MCTKTIKDMSLGWGVVEHRQCEKPEFQNGLCKRHFKRQQEKLVNWGDRELYRPATQHDLDTGRSLKLKDSHVHRLYMCRNGKIKVFSAKTNKYVEVSLPADYKLFCVLDY